MVVNVIQRGKYEYAVRIMLTHVCQYYLLYIIEQISNF